GGQLLRMSNRKALARGTVIHGLFEQVEWVDSIPDRSILLGIAEQLCDPKVDPIQEVTEFEKMLQRSETARILDRKYYLQPFEESIIEALPDEFNAKEARLEVHNERSFVVPDSGRMLSGTVDRLVLIFGKQGLLAADIIDFKTDRLEKGEQALAERVAYYLPQIEAYRRAIHSLFRLPMERIAARLLFVDGGTQWAFPQKQLGSPVS
ncbi:PD-(D/E)XK nuclease family protein, partial [Pirellulaceae bacterium]|nr:PD-(D/E)XK nuclease family protein [Pirellulaceae bacterium]